MTPEDILSNRPSPLTFESERSRTRRSRDSSVDTLPPYSPPRIPLLSPKQDSDVESETLPPPLLSPTLRKEHEVEGPHSESTKGINRSRSSHIRVASKSKPQGVHLHHNAIPSTVGSSSAGISSFHEVGHRMVGSGDSHHVPKKLKLTGLQSVMRGAHANRNESMFSTADSYQPAPFELYDPTDFGRVKENRMQDDSAGYPLTPIELDLGALSMIATLPHLAIGMPTTMRIRSGSILTSVIPEQSAWQRSVYLPGTIHLEPSFIPPSASTLTDIDFSSAHSRTTSDDAVLDGIIDFFLSFGLSDLEPYQRGQSR